MLFGKKNVDAMDVVVKEQMYDTIKDSLCTHKHATNINPNGARTHPHCCSWAEKTEAQQRNNHLQTDPWLVQFLFSFLLFFGCLWLVSISLLSLLHFSSDTSAQALVFLNSFVNVAAFKPARKIYFYHFRYVEKISVKVCQTECKGRLPPQKKRYPSLCSRLWRSMMLTSL